MGAWGWGTYDNDDAADWSAEVTERGLQAVEEALDAVLEGGYVESSDGACALAAADVVARLVSGRGEDSPYCEDVVAWVNAHPGTPAAGLISKAVRAVERVAGGESELAELWAENPTDGPNWRASLGDLTRRLGE